MDIDEEKKAKEFYINSDIEGVHTQVTNTVEINYLDMLKLMHRYAQQRVKNTADLASVSKNKPLPPPPPKDREIHISGKSRHKR